MRPEPVLGAYAGAPFGVPATGRSAGVLRRVLGVAAEPRCRGSPPSHLTIREIEVIASYSVAHQLSRTLA